MTLLADDHFGATVQTLHLFLPDRHFIQLVIAGFFAFLIVLLAEHEHHDVGILFDRPGFTQVRQLRALIFAVFHLTRQLRQGDHGDVELFRDGLEAHGDFRDFIHPVFAFARPAHQLEIVDNQHVQPVGPLEPSRTGGQLADRQGGRVVDIQRAGFQRFGGIDETAEFGLCHITRPDLVGRDFGRFGQDTRSQLLRAHLEAVEPDNATVYRAFGAVMQGAPAVGFGDVEGDVRRKRGFPHRRTTGKDQKVRGVQAAQLFIHINQTGRDTG